MRKQAEANRLQADGFDVAGIHRAQPVSRMERSGIGRGHGGNHGEGTK